MNWYYESRRLTMGELRAKADRTARKAKPGKSRASARAPVRVEGRTIARSFWGRAWCTHIESYSDYDNRLGRGRSYLYAGAVLDLQVGVGVVTAQVQGSALYKQTIEVEVLKPKQRASLVELAAGKIDSLVALLRGQMPPALITAMTDQVHGVFPSSRQIRMRCSCPDVATLCKHLAAVLYGIGARLDSSPELLFRLRGLAVEDLVQSGAAALAVPEIAAQSRATGDLAAMFGIDLVDALPAAVSPAPRARPAPRVRVGREHLKVLGVPNRTIDAWLREGVLVKTEERLIYERTPEADRRIADMLAR
jgi:uncharacterized Zn finger protein